MGGGSAFPQLDFSTFPSQMFWTTVTFTLMYVIMANIVLPPIASVVEKRKNKRSTDLNKASKLNEETEELKTEYEASLETARITATDTVFETEKEIDAEISTALHGFHREAERRILESEEKIKVAKEKALESLTEVSEEVVKEIANKIAHITPSSKEIKSAIEQAKKEEQL